MSSLKSARKSLQKPIKLRATSVSARLSKSQHLSRKLVAPKLKVPPYIKKLIESRSDGLIKLDIGGGNNPQPGFVVMDMRPLPHVHIVHDWEVYPWPLPDSCVSVIVAGHVVEHVNPNRFGFINWMNECWRILKYDGQLVISTPYGGSPGFYADPTHVNPCTQHTWRYFDPIGPDHLWEIYRPKPWKIEKIYFQIHGVMEVLMSKRRLDPEAS